MQPYLTRAPLLCAGRSQKSRSAWQAGCGLGPGGQHVLPGNCTGELHNLPLYTAPSTASRRSVIRSQGKPPNPPYTPFSNRSKACAVPGPSCKGVLVDNQIKERMLSRQDSIAVAPPVPDYPIGTSCSADLERPVIGFKHP